MEKLLEFQLDLLKWELESVSNTIRQIDSMSNSVKNWAVIAWGCALGLAFYQPSFHPYIWVTCFLPMIFWLVDARWRKVQSKAIYRAQKISDYLNSGNLKTSFEVGSLQNFVLYDPMAAKCRQRDFQAFTSLRRILGFGSVSWLYAGLSAFSLLIHVILSLAS